jgi:uncharacterized protein with PQ loop repeat
MNSDTGWSTSFSGFLDYSVCFPQAQPWGWQLLGWLIFTGTVISLTPQVSLIAVQRSSFGLNSFAIFITTFGQFIMIVNVLGLRTADFTGFLQYPFSRTLPRLQTFINYTVLWMTYVPVVFLNGIFFDVEGRSKRTVDKIRTERYFTYVLTVLGPGICLVVLAVWAAGTAVYGCGSSWVVVAGKFFGTLATFLCLAQYLPQMITTCKLKSNGSLSLLLLALQCPGGFLNAGFMWFGQGDDWTTWASILAAAIQQAILLGICLFFKWRKRRSGRGMGAAAGWFGSEGRESTVSGKELTENLLR